MRKRVQRNNKTPANKKSTTPVPHAVQPATESTSTMGMPESNLTPAGILEHQRLQGNQSVLRMLSEHHIQRVGPDDEKLGPDSVVNGVRLGAKTSTNSNPNTYYGAINIIKACTKSLKGHSLAVFPGWGGDYYYIPSYFRSAAMGKDYIMAMTDTTPNLDGAAARNYMRHGLRKINPVLETIKKGSPESGNTWLQSTFHKEYQSTLVTIAERSARQEVNEMADRLKLEGGALSGVTQEQAQMLRAVKFGFSTFDQSKKVIEVLESTQGYDPSSSLKSQFQKVMGGDPPRGLTDDIANLDAPSALAHSVTVLKTIEAIWKISDPEQRQKFARENYPNTFSQAVDVTKFSVELLEVTVGVFSAVGGNCRQIIARL